MVSTKSSTVGEKPISRTDGIRCRLESVLDRQMGPENLSEDNPGGEDRQPSKTGPSLLFDDEASPSRRWDDRKPLTNEAMREASKSAHHSHKHSGDRLKAHFDMDPVIPERKPIYPGFVSPNRRWSTAPEPAGSQNVESPGKEASKSRRPGSETRVSPARWTGNAATG